MKTSSVFQHRFGCKRAYHARLFPNWGRINTRATGADESYHSFQAEFAIDSRKGWNSTPPILLPRRWLTMRDLRIMAALLGKAVEPARLVDPGPPGSTSGMSTAPAAIAGIPPWSTTCRSAAEDSLVPPCPFRRPCYGRMASGQHLSVAKRSV